MQTLNWAVVHAGRIYLPGAVRDTCEGVPDGPWWDGDVPVQAQRERPLGGEPPRAGRGASRSAWAAYADTLGVAYPGDAPRDDIIAAVDAAT